MMEERDNCLHRCRGREEGIRWDSEKRGGGQLMTTEAKECALGKSVYGPSEVSGLEL